VRIVKARDLSALNINPKSHHHIQPIKTNVSENVARDLLATLDDLISKFGLAVPEST